MRVLVVAESAERAEMLRAALRRAELNAEVFVIEVDSAESIKAIVDAVVARFEEFQALRAQLAEANLKLSERKIVEKAKGLLMKRRGLDEEAAYVLLRKMAMDRSVKLAEVARRVLEAADVLGA